MRIRALQVRSSLIIFIVIAVISCSPAQILHLTGGKRVGALQSDLINEASGMAASRTNTGVFWVHNDSGDIPRVYAINASGKLLGIYRISAAKLRDWEDIAIGPGPELGKDYLYIGDIGDNDAKYKSIIVYRVAEPVVDPCNLQDRAIIGPAEVVELVYPDGPRDAETLIVDSENGDMYIITKREPFSKVYRTAADVWESGKTKLEHVATLPWGWAVGGDVSANGELVVVRGYFNASIWRRPKGKELWQAFDTEEYRFELEIENQGESICFAGEGCGCYTVSEKVGSPIYYYDCPKAVRDADN